MKGREEEEVKGREEEDEVRDSVGGRVSEKKE